MATEGPSNTTVSQKDNLKKTKIGAPKIKAPGTENRVSTYNPHNGLRTISVNPPKYQNYVKDGTTDV